MENSVIIIGGLSRHENGTLLKVYRNVTEYNEDGMLVEYPNLNIGRYDSACGYYYINDQLVNFLSMCINLKCVLGFHCIWRF